MDKKTVWSEGMFLGPHHFQQQDRYIHSLVASLYCGSCSFPFGFTQLEIDKTSLATGKIKLLKCEGVFSDGTPFSFENEADLPDPITIDNEYQSQIISLGLPCRTRGSKEISDTAKPQSLARYVLTEEQVNDTHSLDSDSNEKLLTASLWTRLISTTADQSAWESLPITRITEVRADGSLVLDGAYQPCSLLLRANEPLKAICREISALLQQRASDLASRLGTPSSEDSALLSGFMLLQTINRATPLLEHFVQCDTQHPEQVYRELIQLAADISTITAPSRLPPAISEYRHRDQQFSFESLSQALKKSLDWVPDSITESIPVENIKPGIFTATVRDLSLFQTAKFLLAIKADIPSVEIQQFFPVKTTIASREKLKTLVTSHTPGLTLTPLTNLPSSIPVFDDQVFFRIEGDSSHFQEISVSGVFAIHTAGNYPNLSVQMWALKQ